MVQQLCDNNSARQHVMDNSGMEMMDGDTQPSVSQHDTIDLQNFLQMLSRYVLGSLLCEQPLFWVTGSMQRVRSFYTA